MTERVRTCVELRLILFFAELYDIRPEWLKFPDIFRDTISNNGSGECSEHRFALQYTVSVDAVSENVVRKCDDIAWELCKMYNRTFVRMGGLTNVSFPRGINVVVTLDPSTYTYHIHTVVYYVPITPGGETTVQRVAAIMAAHPEALAREVRGRPADTSNDDTLCTKVERISLHETPIA